MRNLITVEGLLDLLKNLRINIMKIHRLAMHRELGTFDE